MPAILGFPLNYLKLGSSQKPLPQRNGFCPCIEAANVITEEEASMSEVIYLTRERMRELEDELRELKTDKRAEIAQKIAEARSYGDLSENAEYDAAKEAQGLLEAKIYRMEQMIARARIIEAGNVPNDKVYILSTVKVLNRKTNRTTEYLMVSAEESDIEQRKLSVSSPIGKALMGKTVGDVVEVNVPAGKITLEIQEIRR